MPKTTPNQTKKRQNPKKIPEKIFKFQQPLFLVSPSSSYNMNPLFVIVVIIIVSFFKKKTEKKNTNTVKQISENPTTKTITSTTKERKFLLFHLTLSHSIYSVQIFIYFCFLFTLLFFLFLFRVCNIFHSHTYINWSTFSLSQIFPHLLSHFSFTLLRYSNVFLFPFDIVILVLILRIEKRRRRCAIAILIAFVQVYTI